ncbi:MAG: hypothetical protein VZR95_00245 [Alphaproteobacteria bacterium]
MRKGLLTILALIGLISVSSVSNAADVPDHIFKQCREKAKTIKLTRVTYKFGKLIFDNTKSTGQVRKMCYNEGAAGCFERTTAAYKFGVEDYLKFDIGKYICVVPQLYADYFWHDARIFITREYNACQIRAVLRHELQHFTIWKSTQDSILTESKKALTELAMKNVRVFSEQSNMPDLIPVIQQTLKDINNRWNSISDKNNALLDKIDHDMETEVNYRVCMPYSIESF